MTYDYNRALLLYDITIKEQEVEFDKFDWDKTDDIILVTIWDKDGSLVYSEMKEK